MVRAEGPAADSRIAALLLCRSRSRAPPSEAATARVALSLRRTHGERKARRPPRSGRQHPSPHTTCGAAIVALHACPPHPPVHLGRRTIKEGGACTLPQCWRRQHCPTQPATPPALVPKRPRTASAPRRAPHHRRRGAPHRRTRSADEPGRVTTATRAAPTRRRAHHAPPNHSPPPPALAARAHAVRAACAGRADAARRPSRRRTPVSPAVVRLHVHRQSRAKHRPTHPAPRATPLRRRASWTLIASRSPPLSARTGVHARASPHAPPPRRRPRRHAPRTSQPALLGRPRSLRPAPRLTRASCSDAADAAARRSAYAERRAPRARGTDHRRAPAALTIAALPSV